MRTLVVEVSPLLTLLVERRSIFSVSLILSCEVNQGNWSKTRGHAGSWRSVRIVSWLVLRLLLRTSKLEDIVEIGERRSLQKWLTCGAPYTTRYCIRSRPSLNNKSSPNRATPRLAILPPPSAYPNIVHIRIVQFYSSEPDSSKSVFCDELPSATGTLASTFPLVPRNERDDQKES